MTRNSAEIGRGEEAFTDALVEKLRAGVLIRSEQQEPITLIMPDGSKIKAGGGTIETRQQCPQCIEAADEIERLRARQPQQAKD